jgi:hypothetical protein
MNKEMQGAIRVLQQRGFQECTEAASRQNRTEYLCAFERVGEKLPVHYCCVTVDDLFALLSLVEASTLR